MHVKSDMPVPAPGLADPQHSEHRWACCSAAIEIPAGKDPDDVYGDPETCCMQGPHLPWEEGVARRKQEFALSADARKKRYTQAQQEIMAQKEKNDKALANNERVLHAKLVRDYMKASQGGSNNEPRLREEFRSLTARNSSEYARGRALSSEQDNLDATLIVTPVPGAVRRSSGEGAVGTRVSFGTPTRQHEVDAEGSRIPHTTLKSNGTTGEKDDVPPTKLRIPSVTGASGRDPRKEAVVQAAGGSSPQQFGSNDGSLLRPPVSSMDKRLAANPTSPARLAANPTSPASDQREVPASLLQQPASYKLRSAGGVNVGGRKQPSATGPDQASMQATATAAAGSATVRSDPLAAAAASTLLEKPAAAAVEGGPAPVPLSTVPPIKPPTHTVLGDFAGSDANAFDVSDRRSSELFRLQNELKTRKDAEALTRQRLADLKQKQKEDDLAREAAWNLKQQKDEEKRAKARADAELLRAKLEENMRKKIEASLEKLSGERKNDDTDLNQTVPRTPRRFQATIDPNRNDLSLAARQPRDEYGRAMAVLGCGPRPQSFLSVGWNCVYPAGWPMWKVYSQPPPWRKRT